MEGEVRFTSSVFLESFVVGHSFEQAHHVRALSLFSIKCSLSNTVPYSTPPHNFGLESHIKENFCTSDTASLSNA